MAKEKIGKLSRDILHYLKILGDNMERASKFYKKESGKEFKSSQKIFYSTLSKYLMRDKFEWVLDTMGIKNRDLRKSAYRSLISLEDKGYVKITREGKKKGRYKNIKLTEKARKFLKNDVYNIVLHM